jgi:MFS family permease
MSKRNSSIYYGWYIVASASVIVLLSMGLRMGIGPFVKPIMEDLSLTRTEFSIIVAVGMILYGLGMPIAGHFLKTHTTRFVLLNGLAVVCGSMVWAIFSTGFISFLLSFGVFLSLGLAFLSSITLTPIISKWFVEARGRALFYLSTGGMAGIAVMVPVESMLLEWVGWKMTLLIFAVVFICIVLPSAIFVMREDVPEGADGKNLRNRNIQSEIPDGLTWKEAVKTKGFWQLAFGMFACGYGMNLMGSHSVPMLMDHGFGPMTASFGFGLIGIVAIFSTLFLGTLADRFPRKNILFWIYLVRGLGILGLTFVATPAQLFFVAAAGGLVWAGSVSLTSAILGDLYGIRLLGFLNGWAYFGHQIGGAIGSFLGGWGYETFGTHTIAFGSAALLALIAAIASYFLPRKITFEKKIPMVDGHSLSK